jgi:hypothetical protein
VRGYYPEVAGGIDLKAKRSNWWSFT